MSVASVKQLIKKIVFPTYTHEKIYVIDQTNLTKKLQFSTTLKPLGKWYITTGNHWFCHSELTLADFQKAFIQQAQVSTDEAQKLEFTTDYLPFSEILLLTVYPQIFKIIYMSGRDFGRSLVNALLP